MGMSRSKSVPWCHLDGPTRRQALYHVAWPLGLLLVALALRLPHLGRGLEYDEIYTAVRFVEVDSVWTTISTYVTYNNHIAYSLLARWSEGLFGRSEWALRLPALLLGLAGPYALWLFARGLIRPGPAVAAAFALAISPPHVAWSVTARGYTGLILCTLLANALFLGLLERGGMRRALPFVGASVLGVYFHLYGVFVTAVQVLFLASLQARRRFAGRRTLGGEGGAVRTVWLSFVAVGCLSALLYAPVAGPLLQMLARGQRGEFVPAFPWQVAEELSGSARPALTGLILLVSAFGALRLGRARPREAGFLILLILLPIGAVWLSRPANLFPRFFVYLLPYLLLLLVVGVLGLWRGPGGTRRPFLAYASRAAAAGLASAVLVAWLVGARDDVFEEGIRDASRAMQADAAEGTLFCAIGGGAELFDYYVDGVVIPDTLRELQQLARRHPEVRCAYRQTSWERREHAEIGRFLAQNAAAETFRNVTLFRYRR